MSIYWIFVFFFPLFYFFNIQSNSCLFMKFFTFYFHLFGFIIIVQFIYLISQYLAINFVKFVCVWCLCLSGFFFFVCLSVYPFCSLSKSNYNFSINLFTLLLAKFNTYIGNPVFHFTENIIR